MAVYDQWHRKPRPGEQPCKCGTKASPLYPGAEHKRGRRWLVRYLAPDGSQPSRSFDLKVGTDPNRHADAYDKMIAEQLRTGTYVDPALAGTTFQAYAEEWRKSRGHDVVTAANVERRLRLHVYEDPEHPGSGKTPKGGVSVGQHSLGLLAQRPSLTQGWIQAMPLAQSTRRLVVGDVSAIYAAAIDDGIIGRDPTKSKSVERPARDPKRARPWTAAQAGAMREQLPPRYRVIIDLGTGTGMRQGEMFGLGVDDITFLGRKPEVRVVRQVKLIGGKPRFAPVKNRKVHAVPLAPSLAAALARHLKEFPAAKVTLPWHDPRDRAMHGTMVSVRLVLCTPAGGALERQPFNGSVWRPARERAGIVPPREPGQRSSPSREDGCHALRHTFASVQLRAHVDVARLAAWMGDTPKVVLDTYVHLLPDDDDADGRAAVDGFLAASLAPDSHREAPNGTSGQAAGTSSHLYREWRRGFRRRRPGARDFGLGSAACRLALTRTYANLHGLSRSLAPGLHRQRVRHVPAHAGGQLGQALIRDGVEDLAGRPLGDAGGAYEVIDGR